SFRASSGGTVARVAVRVGRRATFLQVGDRHGLDTIGHTVALDVIGVRGRDAREADELPADLAAVPAVDRVREEALLRVLPEEREEEPRGHRLQAERSLVERAEDLLLLHGQKRGEALAVRRLATPIGLRDRGAVHLLGRQPRLVSLLGRALGPRTLAVFAGHRAEGAGELAVDEDGDARLLRPRSQLVGGGGPPRRRPRGPRPRGP